MEFLKTDLVRWISIGLFVIGLAITLAYAYLVRRLTKTGVKTMPASLIMLVGAGTVIESLGIIGFMISGGFRH